MKVKVVNLLLIFILCSVSNLYAFYFKPAYTVAESDTLKSKKIQWIDLGLGWSFTTAKRSSIEGPTIGFNYTWLQKRNSIQISVCHVQRSSSLITDIVNLNNISLSIGKHLVKPNYITGLTFGPGYMWGRIYRGSGGSIKYDRIGVAINAMIARKIGRDTGLGLEAFCYLNDKVTSTGLKIILQFRNKR